jgi:hypothetical protein
MVSIAAYVFLVVRVDPAARSHHEQVIVGICVGLTGAVIGKILGVLWARFQYRQLLNTRGHATTPPSGAGGRVVNFKMRTLLDVFREHDIESTSG